MTQNPLNIYNIWNFFFGNAIELVSQINRFCRYFQKQSFQNCLHRQPSLRMKNKKYSDKNKKTLKRKGNFNYLFFKL